MIQPRSRKGTCFESSETPSIEREGRCHHDRMLGGDNQALQGKAQSSLHSLRQVANGEPDRLCRTLSMNLAIRQRLLQFGNASFGHLRPLDIQSLKSFQAGEVDQAGIGHLRIAEIKVRET